MFNVKTDVISVRNDGAQILDTNFWDGSMARSGGVFLTWNAGAARLLLPDAIAAVVIFEVAGAYEVIISRGHWKQARTQDALEVLFEDGSDAPFSIHLPARQTDRLLPKQDHGRSFELTVWTRQGEQMRFPGKYRVVRDLPFLQPWK